MARALGVGAMLFCVASAATAEPAVTVEPETTELASTRADVAAGAGGFYLLTREVDPTVILRRLDDVGRSAGSPIGVVDLVSREEPNVGIRVLASGDNAAIAWDEKPGGADFPDAGSAWSQLFGPAGPVTEPKRVWQISNSFVALTRPVASSTDGHYFFTIGSVQTLGHDPQYYEISRFFDAAGQPGGTAAHGFVTAATPFGSGFALSHWHNIDDVEIYDGGGVITEAFDSPLPSGDFNGFLEGPLGDELLFTEGDPMPGGRILFFQSYDRAAGTVGDPVAYTEPAARSTVPVDPIHTPGGGYLFLWRHLVDEVTGETAHYVRYLRPDGVLEPALETGGDGHWKPYGSITPDGRFLLVEGDSEGPVKLRRGALDLGWTVDGFEVAQAALTLPAPAAVGDSLTGSVDGVDQVGGQREASLELVGGTSGSASLEVAGGALEHLQTGDTTAISTVVWDQRDDDPAALDRVGLHELDLTSGGSRDAVAVDIASAGAGASITVELHDADADSSFELDLPAGAVDALAVIPFAAFAGGVDAASIGAASLTVDGSSTPGLGVSLRSIETAGLVGASLAASPVVDGQEPVPGSLIAYTVEITNPADLVGATAEAVTYSDESPLGEELICAGVDGPTASQGSITGCGPGLAVDLGDLGDGDTATVTFRTRVLSSAGDEVCRTGRLSSATLAGALSDDPSTAADADATCTGVAAPAVVTLDTSATLAADAQGDGLLQPGDELELEVVVTHAGGVRSAESLVLTHTSPDASLVAGSVVTSQGAVVSGNGLGDTALEVDLGDLAPAAQATVTFRVRIGAPSAYVPGVQSFALVEGPGTWVRDHFESEPVVAAPDVVITMRDTLVVDLDGDGRADPGDRIHYDIVMINDGDRDFGDRQATIQLPSDTVWIPESLTMSRGSVESSLPDWLRINTGGLEGSQDRIDISIAVDVGVMQPWNDPLRARVITFNLERVGSDDPDTPGANDSTTTPTDNFTIFADGFENGRTSRWDDEVP